MDEEVPTVVERGFRCRECDRPYRHKILVDVSVKRAIASMMAVRCPHCGAGAKKATMGEHLSLSEDMARRQPLASLDDRIANWLAVGEIGSSSKAIHDHMTGKPHGPFGPSAPSDLDDLRRCILVLGHMPEWIGRMPEMAVHEAWAGLAPSFETIVSSYLREYPDLRGSAPETAALFEQAAGGRA